MNLSSIKLVASDMDGTLLNSDHEISALFFEIFEELKKHDIRFVAASGRPYYSIIDKLGAIKNDIIIAAENGGIVVEKENIQKYVIQKNTFYKVYPRVVFLRYSL